MSWQLAVWVGVHGKGDKPVVDVVRELALNSHHDGTSLYAPTWGELALRTRTSRSTVATALKTARDLGVISEDQPGGGRGRATVYRVHYWLCDPLSSCPVCSTLASCLPERVQLPDLNQAPSPPSTGKGPAPGPYREEKGSSSRTYPKRNGPAQAGKGPDEPLKGPAPGPTSNEGGRNHPQGGSFPPGESSDREPLRSAASGSAARSGQAPKRDDPEPAAVVIPPELQALKAKWKREEYRRRRGVEPPPDYGTRPPTPAAAGPAPRAGPEAQAAAEAEAEPPRPADRPAPIPVEDPADVEYPGGLGHLVGRCVICEQDCTSIHAVSSQVRHATCKDPPAKEDAA
jgi:hypothetical protein